MSTASALRDAVDRSLEYTVVGSFSRIGYAARRSLFGWRDVAAGELAGRVVVVTGATSGLGLAAAHRLAEGGAHVVVVGRDPDRTEAARQAICERTANVDVDAVVADLASLTSVRTAACELLASLPRIDALVHNAGALVHDLELTEDGIEVTAQTHVVAPFLLTAFLLPQLRLADRPRVITVSSGGMYTQHLDVDALDAPREPFDGVRAYANAKRAQVVMNENWSRHGAGEGITFHAMHPGWADTPGVQASLPRFRRLMGPLLRTPAQGADTMVWLAAAPEPLECNGAFWLDRRARSTHLLPFTRTTDLEADRLWSWCSERSGARTLVELAP